MKLIYFLISIILYQYMQLFESGCAHFFRCIFENNDLFRSGLQKKNFYQYRTNLVTQSSFCRIILCRIFLLSDTYTKPGKPRSNQKLCSCFLMIFIDGFAPSQKSEKRFSIYTKFTGIDDSTMFKLFSVMQERRSNSDHLNKHFFMEKICTITL